MKTKFYYFVLIVGVALITVSFVSKNKNPVVDTADSNKQEQAAATGENNGSEQKYFEGVLYKSDDSRYGNYKLVTSDSDIYIKTSRDFSALIGLEVLTLIDGTKDKFELLDIQAKVAKDGFIKQQ